MTTAMATVKTRVRDILVNTALGLGSIVVALIVLEVVVRVFTPGIGFEWRNYATDPVNMIKVNTLVQYDPDLAYVLVPNRMDAGFGRLGNRLNRPTQPSDPVPPIPERPVLALGDSFTFGSDVNADQTWPAHLERILGVPVLNGGVGGYGIDQMVVLGERLAPQLKPRLIVLSFIPDDLERARMSIYSGAPKPYFDVVDGKLVRRNHPAPIYQPSLRHAGIRGVLGYSYLINWTATRLGLLQWWQLSRWEYRFSDADPAAVNCLLTGRLRELGERFDAPVLVVGQYAWDNYQPHMATMVERQRAVLDCARKQGLAVLDTYDLLRSELPTKWTLDTYGRYYVKGLGHMTDEGNRTIATAIAGVLRERFADKLAP